MSEKIRNFVGLLTTIQKWRVLLRRVDMKLIMRKIILYSVVAVIGLLCAACNSDIFVEPVPDLEKDTYYLDCNGSPVSFKIPTKGLRMVSFDCDHSTIAGVNYYDKDSEYLDNPTLDNVAKVVFSSPLFCLNFDIDGDNIKVTALDNTMPEYVKVWVSLEYEHTFRFIDFVISPGQPLQIADLICNVTNQIDGQYTERGINKTFINNSDHIQHIGLYPYKEVKSKIKLEIEDYDYWARGVKGTVAVPIYSNGEWCYSEGNMADVTIGYVARFDSKSVDAEETVTIEVAPHSKVTTVTYITYATLDAHYAANLKQSGSGLMFWLEGECRLMQPISYKIEQQ